MKGGRAARTRVAALLVILALSACSLLPGGEDEADPFPEAAAPTGPVVRHAVTFEGPIDAELRSALEGASAARAEAARPPASAFLLERRAEADLANLESALRSLGYYDGTVSYEVRGLVEPVPPPGDGVAGKVEAQVDDALDAPAAKLVFLVEPGARYRLAELAVIVDDPAAGFEPPALDTLGLRPGEPASAAVILAAQTRLVEAARSAAHPFAAAGPLDAVIDKDQRTMDVSLHLRSGPTATFGEVGFSGAEGVSRRFLAGRVPFQRGQAYDPAQVVAARRSLIETNLFSTVIVREGPTLAPGGELPVRFELTQRKPRSIGASIGYQTDEGPNGALFWEHRNILGAGERLRFELYGSPVRQEAGVNFAKPDVLAPRQNLLATSSVKREDTDAYQSESIGAGVGLEREFTPNLKGAAGVAYRFGRIKEDDEAENEFGLLLLPTRLDWDFSDDLLDPTRGGRLFLVATPYTDTLNWGTNFFKAQATTTRYLPLLDDPRLILALRASVGSIIGAGRDDVPADERFYAGGGGSIRGFGFQLAGPVDDDDDPEGGRSLFEANGELRYRVTPGIGVVAFLDAGSVFDATYPDFSEELFYGSGLGLRYVTPIGPLRLDVGVPLNPRNGVDDLFQVYISIGQAF